MKSYICNLMNEYYNRVTQTLGMWNSNTKVLSIDETSANWNSHSDTTPDSDVTPTDADTPIYNKVTVSPRSICSRPCAPRQYRIQMDIKCCWECRYDTTIHYLFTDYYAYLCWNSVNITGC